MKIWSSKVKVISVIDNNNRIKYFRCKPDCNAAF